MTYSPVIVVSSWAHPLILGLNFLKLTKSKTDFETNTVETGSKLYPVDTHCIKSSTSTTIIPTSDVYWPCQLLLNKKACWMVIIRLVIVIILTTVASQPYLEGIIGIIILLLGHNLRNPKRIVGCTSSTGHSRKSQLRS